MAVPYAFAFTPFGTPLQLTQLDANFDYLTNGTAISPAVFGYLTLTGNLLVSGTSTFSKPVTMNDTLTVVGKTTVVDFDLTGSFIIDGITVNPTGITGSGFLVLNTNPIFVNPALGTPASGNLANCTNLPIGSINGFGLGVIQFLTNPTSANLANAVIDRTGSGQLVFNNTPNLVSPILGTPTSGNLVNCTGYQATNILGILPITNGGTGAGTPSTAINNLLPSQAGQSNNVLKTNGIDVLWAPESGTPAPPPNSVQYNNAGSFGGSLGFTFNGVSQVNIGIPSSNNAQINLYNSANNNAVSVVPTTGSSSWTMTLPASAGNATQFLMTDGLGNTSWQSSTVAVPNIAALRILPIYLNQLVYVEGYYAPNDGGGGLFTGFTGSPAGTYVDNGGSIIVPTDGSTAWLRDTSNGVSVRWFGAYGDGSANDTVAFTNALNSVSANTVWVPPGRYLIDPITIPNYVNLCGTLMGPFDGEGTLTSITRAPTILVNSDTSSAITMNGYQISISDLLFFYPNQVAPTAAAPIVFNPTITIQGGGGHTVARCTFVNSYDAISVEVGRVTIQGCIIGGFHRGIEIDNALDWVVVKDIWNQVMWDVYANLPFPQPIDTWVLNNGIALEAARVDSLAVDNLACFARYAGMAFIDSTTPIIPKNGYGRCSNLDFDYVAYGIIANSTSNSGGGYKITNMDIGANGSGVGTPGQATIQLNAGGTEPSIITWQGGSVRGGWAYGSTFASVVSGNAYVSEVVNINTIGPVPSPPAPASGINFPNPYGTSMRVGFQITGAGANLSSLTLNGNGTGLIGLDGFFIVRSGEIINMTYVGTLNWAWFTL